MTKKQVSAQIEEKLQREALIHGLSWTDCLNYGVKAKLGLIGVENEISKSKDRIKQNKDLIREKEQEIKYLELRVKELQEIETQKQKEEEKNVILEF